MASPRDQAFWLSDDVVYHYLDMLAIRSRSPGSEYAKTYVIDPEVWHFLFHEEPDYLGPLEEGVSLRFLLSTRLIFQLGSSLLEHELLLFPVNKGGSHWILFAVWPADKTILCFDSCKSMDQNVLRVSFNLV